MAEVPFKDFKEAEKSVDKLINHVDKYISNTERRLGKGKKFEAKYSKEDGIEAKLERSLVIEGDANFSKLYGHKEYIGKFHIEILPSGYTKINASTPKLEEEIKRQIEPKS